jgi:putative ABC transport system permease protein
VREELLKILPDVHIEEQGEKALARAEARREAADVARKNLEAEEEGRAQLLALGDRFRLLFVPLILITAGIWLALLALGNVRERRTEVGLLNAIGFPAKRIAGVFLLRAVLIGLTGAATGALAGFWFGEAAFRLSVAGTDAAPVGTFDPRIFLAAIVTAPVLSALACWIPAFLATQQDPAVVLRSD